MKSKLEILSEITGIDKDRLPHDTIRASDALEAMDIYKDQKDEVDIDHSRINDHFLNMIEAATKKGIESLEGKEWL